MGNVFSLRRAPTVLGTLGFCVLLPLKQRFFASLAFITGVLVSAAVLIVQPIPLLRAVDGEDDVAIVELGRHAMCPPLSIFFPVKKRRKSTVRGWLPFGDARYLYGMAQYSAMPSILFHDLKGAKVEALSDAPFVLYDSNDRPKPIYVFSHGIAGYAQLYTSLLMNVAARGGIVIALTHMDGSAVFCRDATNDFCIPYDTTLRFTAGDRDGQLQQRVMEVGLVVDQIISGELFLRLGCSPEEVAQYRSWHSNINFIGHSFGGSTVLHYLTQSDSRQVGTIACLDPWHVPLQHLVHEESLKPRYHVPTLLLFSEEWSDFEGSMPFFTRFSKCISTCVTSRTFPRTDHLTCTDMALLNRAARKKAIFFVNPIRHISLWAEMIVQFSKSFTV